MFDTRFEHVYIDLVKIWNKYPDIQREYQKTRGEKEENIDLFIQNNFSDCFDEMLQIFERHFGENYDVPQKENIEFFSRYFGTFWHQTIEE